MIYSSRRGCLTRFVESLRSVRAALFAGTRTYSTDHSYHAFQSAGPCGTPGSTHSSMFQLGPCHRRVSLSSPVRMISVWRRRPFSYKKKARLMRHRAEMRKEKYSYKIVSAGATRRQRRTPREIYKMRPRAGKLYGRTKYVAIRKKQR